MNLFTTASVPCTIAYSLHDLICFSDTKPGFLISSFVHCFCTVCSILISQFEYLPDELRLMGLSAVLARFACCWLSFLGMSELSLPPVFDTLPQSQTFATPTIPVVVNTRVMVVGKEAIVPRHLYKIGPGYDPSLLHTASNQTWKWGKVWE